MTKQCTPRNRPNSAYVVRKCGSKCGPCMFMPIFIITAKNWNQLRGTSRTECVNADKLV